MDGVRAFFNKYRGLVEGKNIGVAVSGGSDSMSLLNYMLEIKDLFKFSIAVINLDHGMRGDESAADSQFVKDFCKRKKIKIHHKKVDALEYSKQNKCNLEEAARILRYGFFEKLKSGEKIDFICTAHNADDFVEGVLLNLFRGAGTSGASGMEEISGFTLRPMLSVFKTEVVRYINDSNIPYVTDKTNLDTSYSRNYLRHKIMPLIEEKFEGFKGNIIKFSEILKIESGFLEKEAEKLLTRENDSVCVNISGSEEALLKRAFVSALNKLGLRKDITKENIDRILSLCCKENGKRADVSKNLTVYKQGKTVVIARKQKKQTFIVPFRDGIFTLNGYEIKIEKTANREQTTANSLKGGQLYFDAGSVWGAVFRPRRNGDIFKRFKGGTKTFSDYLTDIKADKMLREQAVVLAKGCEVLLALPFDISDGIKVSDKTETIYKLTYKFRE